MTSSLQKCCQFPMLKYTLLFWILFFMVQNPPHSTGIWNDTPVGALKRSPNKARDPSIQQAASKMLPFFVSSYIISLCESRSAMKPYRGGWGGIPLFPPKDSICKMPALLVLRGEGRASLRPWSRREALFCILLEMWRVWWIFLFGFFRKCQRNVIWWYILRKTNYVEKPFNA